MVKQLKVYLIQKNGNPVMPSQAGEAIKVDVEFPLTKENELMFVSLVKILQGGQIKFKIINKDFKAVAYQATEKTCAIKINIANSDVGYPIIYMSLDIFGDTIEDHLSIYKAKNYILEY
jgi:hypothetical protein